MTFEEYVRVRGPALVRLARLLTRDAHLAEDLVQDVLGRAYPRWPGIIRADDPDLYLRRMLVNANISRWRRRASREVLGHVPDEVADRGDADVEMVERDEIWSALAGLSRKQRATIVLRYYEDLDDSTIATILDCSTVTVRTHAMRALAALRSRLTAAEPADPARSRS